MTMIHPDTVHSPPIKDRSKTITTQIPISIDQDGCPELPKVTMSDGYKTKVVQSMLREYCTAHIRELSYNPFVTLCNMYAPGFVTGKTKQIIPWGQLVKDPSAWIDKACIPYGFKWKDPSKIQIGEVFRLLDHWKDREAQDLIPLIWVPACPLFQDVEELQKKRRNVRQARTLQPEDSDEEVFHLPSSGDLDHEDDEFDTHDYLDKSSTKPDSSDDGESDESQSQGGSPGECTHYIPILALISCTSSSNSRWKRELRCVTP